jgi:hypothetical protein
VGALVYDLGLSIVGTAGHQHYRALGTRSAVDSSFGYMGDRRSDDHYGRRHRHMVDSWSQEHSSLSWDDPFAPRIACVVTARDSETRFAQRTSGASANVRAPTEKFEPFERSGRRQRSGSPSQAVQPAQPFRELVPTREI